MNNIKELEKQLRIVEKDLKNMLVYGDEVIVHSLREKIYSLQVKIKKLKQ